jgi:hypothetical protein
VVHGSGWSIVHDANQVWCDIGGIAFQLAKFEIAITEKMLVLKDLSSDWTTYLKR